MKAKSKWLTMALAAVVLAVNAIGCAAETGEVKQIVTENQDTSEDESNSAETDAELDTETGTTNSDEAEEISSDEGEDAPKVADVTIEEQVLIDQDGIVITAKEYETDSIWGDGIKLLIENNTDQNIAVGCDALIVNNYMITDLFSASVAAGKKSNETMELSSSELKAAGIDTVGQVEVYFHVYDDDSWEKITDFDVVTIKTSAYENMDTTPNDAGAELYNDNGVRIVGKTVDEESFWGTAILLYIENHTGKDIGVQVENMSINGFMMDPFFSATVYDGKMVIDDIDVLSSELEDNGIESINEVELQFHVFDEHTYNTLFDTEAITFSAQ